MTTGSRIRIDGFADQGWDEELLERGEKPVGAEDEPFRVEVVGSNPAGPTKRRIEPIEAKNFNTLWTLKKNGYARLDEILSSSTLR
jgi:hypothetical protein